MRFQTAIVFCATFVGLFSSIITFNFLVEYKVLPTKSQKLAALDVEPVAASASTTKEEVPTPNIPTLKPVSPIESIVAKALSGSKGTYAVAIKNLKTGETYYKDETKSYESASLYKLWVMGTTYDQVKTGMLTENEMLRADIPTINKQFNIASESAEQKTGSVSLSVKSALYQMITISHNYAALLLTSKVKLANINYYLENHGLLASKTGTPPKTTAADTLQFFEKLYKGELADKEYTNKMLDLLKQQKLNIKLPKYLPQEIVMAHKTGELGGVSHDGGIVYTDKGDYIIVVLSDSNAPNGAEDRIATISKNVYAYFTSK
jgi:beta-lactamase class A